LNRDLVAVAHFTDLNEAHIACGFLRANGIAAVLHDTNLVSIGLPAAQDIGGIKLMAPEDESPAARQLLQEVASGVFAFAGDSGDQD
jgi:hypothetical protein